VLKHVTITGGTGGLGKAVARQFRESGNRVSSLGSQDLDLSDRRKTDEYFSKQPCDLLVCAAGIVRDRLLAQMSEEDWCEVFEVNFTAARNSALSAIRQMANRGNGHVIFISSYAADHPAPGQSAYATAKAALNGLTKDLAAEFGGAGVRVNGIMPGFLETPMTAPVSEERKSLVRGLHVLKEFNTPECVAEFINFLDEKMTLTSGQIFQLDSRL